MGEAGTDVRVEATIAGGQRTSNAVVVDSSTMVTTMAAVAGATKLAALLPDGRRLTAKLLGKDARSGVAVISITGGRLHAASTGSAVPLRKGERLWMAGEGDPGTISDLGRNTTSPDGSKLRHVIRLDVDERKAREGMALVDGDGAVVALCTWDAKGDVVGIPIDLATSAARSLRDNGGRLVLPWIGVTGRDVEPDRKAGVPYGAALLTAVDDGRTGRHRRPGARRCRAVPGRDQGLVDQRAGAGGSILRHRGHRRRSRSCGPGSRCSCPSRSGGCPDPHDPLRRTRARRTARRMPRPTSVAIAASTTAAAPRASSWRRFGLSVVHHLASVPAT